ncbi:TPA: 4-hydroxy-2-ketovalerate aldolase [Campylobacter jejuni]|nr:4-hydroxy-2-ketovalerate aldolase [Campylobacter jejuni]HEF7786428.1 4-hydroxy-2-ketovalerate aldolase [Campylobacter jejuni]HEF7824136.1 4-hydroxy-2-ketovalerate aldolase [Campylobacter jejuni]
MSNNIKILDCTLRDGTHINKGKFGKENILSIIKNLVKVKIDLIEVGFLQNTLYDENSSIFSEIKYIDEILSQVKKTQSKFGMMLRTDRCDFNKLKGSDFVDFARIAFYKEHLKDLVNYVNRLQDLNYSVYLNPIAITKYSFDEIKSILEAILPLKPKGISLVDTFGALQTDSFIKLIKFFNEIIPDDIEIGIHLHENLSSSLSLALQGVSLLSHRDIIIDSSVNGMGRIPGNLPTELIVNHINVDNKYNVNPLYDLNDIIKEYKKINEWGYNPIYVHSAILNIDRTYPEYFNTQGFSTLENIVLQNEIKRLGYGYKFAQEKADEIIKDNPC